MKLIKTASGRSLKLSKKEWEEIGKTAGWGDEYKDESLEYKRELTAPTLESTGPADPISEDDIASMEARGLSDNAEEVANFIDENIGLNYLGWVKYIADNYGHDLSSFEERIEKINDLSKEYLDAKHSLHKDFIKAILDLEKSDPSAFNDLHKKMMNS